MSEQAGFKEPSYFCPYDFFDGERKISSWDEYLKLFSSAPYNATFVGDASTRYLRSEEAIRKIAATCPDAHYIVMLRNPVDLAISLNNQRTKEGRENLNFEDAWRAEGKRKLGQMLPPGVIHWRALAYAQSSMLRAQIQHLFNTVGRNKIHIIFYDDFKTHTEHCYHRVLNFLNIPDDDRQSFERLNRSTVFRSPKIEDWLQSAKRVRNQLGLPGGMGIHTTINRFNTKHGHQPIRNEFMRELQDYFEEDISLLSRLTGRDLSSWKADTRS